MENHRGGQKRFAVWAARYLRVPGQAGRRQRKEAEGLLRLAVTSWVSSDCAGIRAAATEWRGCSTRAISEHDDPYGTDKRARVADDPSRPGAFFIYTK